MLKSVFEKIGLVWFLVPTILVVSENCYSSLNFVFSMLRTKKKKIWESNLFVMFSLSSLFLRI